jgi:hypothetical protein
MLCLASAPVPIMRCMGGIPLSEWSGSGATRQLEATIREFNEETSRQTATMIRLTRWIVVLTVVLVAGLIVQIIIALA